MAKLVLIYIAIGIISCWSSLLGLKADINKKSAINYKGLRIEHNKHANTISIFRSRSKNALLTQIAKVNERPYIHPIIAPDGKGVLTEYRPKHHLHQTGLYWGLKRVNGRDYFMKWQGDYWRRVSAKVLEKKGNRVKWQTKYDLLDSTGTAILTETQKWAMQEHEGKYLLDLEWQGKAKIDVTFGKFYVGGLFLRMPWTKGIAGEVVNELGQRNQAAESRRAKWVDLGMQINGRDDWAHVAIFDHPKNNSFPVAWRVDGELGVGPSRQILGDWKITKGETEIIRYRLIIYTGKLNEAELNQAWTNFSAAK